MSGFFKALYKSFRSLCAFLRRITYIAHLKTQIYEMILSEHMRVIPFLKIILVNFKAIHNKESVATIAAYNWLRVS